MIRIKNNLKLNNLNKSLLRCYSSNNSKNTQNQGYIDVSGYFYLLIHITYLNWTVIPAWVKFS